MFSFSAAESAYPTVKISRKLPFVTADDAIEHEFILEDTIAIMRGGVEGFEAFLAFCNDSAIRRREKYLVSHLYR